MDKQFLIHQKQKDIQGSLIDVNLTTHKNKIKCNKQIEEFEKKHIQYKLQEKYKSL